MVLQCMHLRAFVFLARRSTSTYQPVRAKTGLCINPTDLHRSTRPCSQHNLPCMHENRGSFRVLQAADRSGHPPGRAVHCALGQATRAAQQCHRVHLCALRPPPAGEVPAGQQLRGRMGGAKGTGSTGMRALALLVLGEHAATASTKRHPSHPPLQP